MTLEQAQNPKTFSSINDLVDLVGLIFPKA